MVLAQWRQVGAPGRGVLGAYSIQAVPSLGSTDAPGLPGWAFDGGPGVHSFQIHGERHAAQSGVEPDSLTVRRLLA